MRDPAVTQEFLDPAGWEAALKEHIRFRVVDIQRQSDQPFSVASSMLACGELGILSVDAPTPFVCEKYQHDFATFYLPYHRHSAWSDGDQLLIGRHQESILYLAPGADPSRVARAACGCDVARRGVLECDSSALAALPCV